METIFELETFRVKLKVSTPAGERMMYPEMVNEILRPIYDELDALQEHFAVLFLDNKCKLRGYKVVASGTQTSASVGYAIVFRAALLFGAARIVLAHNHPSGDPAPSAEDRSLTSSLVVLGRQLGVPVDDHIIVGDGASSCYSFSWETFNDLVTSMGTWPRNRERGAYKVERPTLICSKKKAAEPVE